MSNEKKQLNKEQKSAVSHREGPMLVVAGAGTGKTTILVERLRYLVENKLAKGDEILLLTFTEKGAGEMEERALEVLPYGYFDLWISTFHSFCERILREHALDIGLAPDFKLLTTTEQWILIRKNIDKFELDYFRPLGNPNKFIYELVKHFSRLKDEYIQESEYEKYTGKKIKPEEKEEMAKYKELAGAYKVYNKLLVENGYLDFGDLINYTIKLFKDRPSILKYYQNKFKYTMIDEFQDTNWSQFELIKLLTKPNDNLLVVGDDDQSIYKFRGASLSNILQFKDEYPSAKEVVLTCNYRSGQKILDTAYDFIQHNNPNRLEEKIKINKKLKSGLGTKAQVEHFHFASQLEEQTWVAEKIMEMKKSDPGLNWSDFAILVRANSSAEDFVTELKRAQIPSTFISLRGLYYKSIILDCVAYLRLLDHYHESSALFRVLNMEVFRVNHKDLVALTRFARRKGQSLFEAMQKASGIIELSEAAKHNIAFLIGLVRKHSELVQKETPSRVFVHFVHDAGIDNKDYHENREHFSYLNQFYEKIKKFDNDFPGSRLRDFMDLLELELESGESGSLRLDFEDSDTVSIMTVHASKGLEFKNVFIVNLVDKKFPTINRKDKIIIPDELVKEKINNTKDAHIEEERRLFYVALTRAKENLFLTSAKDCGGVREKKPSPFLSETKITSSAMVSDHLSSNILLRDISSISSPLVGEHIQYELPSKFSFSQIEAFANCPLQYKFNFILKVPVLAKPVFIFGRLMHNTLKDFMSQFVTNPQSSIFPENTKKENPKLKELNDFYQKHWNNDGYKDKKEREEYKKSGLEMLDKFYNLMQEKGWPKVVYTEKAFTHRIGNYMFRGSVDRIDKLTDGSLEIVDYKTGSPKEKLSYQDKKQLILYKIALEEGLGEKVSKQTFIYLKNGSEMSFGSSAKDEEKLKSETQETIEEIAKCNFPPKPGFLCDYCDFNNICEFRQKN